MIVSKQRPPESVIVGSDIEHFVDIKDSGRQVSVLGRNREDGVLVFGSPHEGSRHEGKIEGNTPTSSVWRAPSAIISHSRAVFRIAKERPFGTRGSTEVIPLGVENGRPIMPLKEDPSGIGGHLWSGIHLHFGDEMWKERFQIEDKYQRLRAIAPLIAAMMTTPDRLEVIEPSLRLTARKTTPADRLNFNIPDENNLEKYDIMLNGTRDKDAVTLEFRVPNTPFHPAYGGLAAALCVAALSREEVPPMEETYRQDYINCCRGNMSVKITNMGREMHAVDALKTFATENRDVLKFLTADPEIREVMHAAVTNGFGMKDCALLLEAACADWREFFSVLGRLVDAG